MKLPVSLWCFGKFKHSHMIHRSFIILHNNDKLTKIAFESFIYLYIYYMHTLYHEGGYRIGLDTVHPLFIVLIQESNQFKVP